MHSAVKEAETTKIHLYKDWIIHYLKQEFYMTDVQT